MFQQEIDISDIPEGTYRLRAVADPDGWFDELDESNNEYTVEITWHIKDGAPYVEVLGSPAPSATP